MNQMVGTSVLCSAAFLKYNLEGCDHLELYRCWETRLHIAATDSASHDLGNRPPLHVLISHLQMDVKITRKKWSTVDLAKTKNHPQGTRMGKGSSVVLNFSPVLNDDFYGLTTLKYVLLLI